MTRRAEPGRFELNSFIIKSITTGNSVDIGSVVYSFGINESMSNGFVDGYATVFDSTGILYDLPIRGEEIVEITYTDFFEEVRTDKFFVYSIVDTKLTKQESSEGKMLQYTLQFVSLAKLDTDKKRIRKSFTQDNIKEYVQRVFKENYEGGLNEKVLEEVEDTSGIQTIVVPNYTPEETMHLFSRRAYSDTYPDSTFRFFETRDKFHFTTNGNIISKAPTEVTERNTFEYNAYPDHTPSGQAKIMQSIVDIQMGELVDTFRDIKEGAYLKEIYEIDFINRTSVKTEYKYLDEYQKYAFPSGQPEAPYHGQEFVDAHFEMNKRKYALKDYNGLGEPITPGLRPYPHYKESLSHKNTAFYHYSTNVIVLSVYGRNSLFAGDIIQLDIPQFRFSQPDTPPEADADRSGKYLVEAVKNEFVEDIYKQTLVLTKSGL